ncbi:RTA1 like protein-domain-containing protein [Naematelia encephala]|uniref:RTA1 like protein-domain-containing protein n=1 Tax=Naematelia encephala TaxID=71784 RepID=A0A1Y2B5E8_9TREE|nr:RTA1 like protein-domain-containing protein [Naematelia encephala]
MSCVYYNSTLGETTFAVACNYNNGSVNLVTGQVEYSDYGYTLTGWATYTLLVFFAIATFCHVLLGVYWRTWWTIPTLGLGTLGETVGWASRVWSIKSTKWDFNYGGMWDSNHNAFIAQICCTVISPTLFSAANYILLGKLITATGNRYCTLTPKSLSIAFMLSDFLCLIVQAAGGGWAGTADTSVDSNKGAKVMTAGVILQLIVTVVYVVVLAEFLYRRHTDLPVRRQIDLFSKTCCRTRRDKTSLNNGSETNSDTELADKNQPSYETATSIQSLSNVTTTKGRVNLMIGMILFSTLLIVIRSVYRSIELSNGWSGPVATNQPLFLGMDALLMVILVWAYVVIHPGITLGRKLFNLRN